MFEVTYIFDSEGQGTGKVTKASALGKGKRQANSPPPKRTASPSPAASTGPSSETAAAAVDTATASAAVASTSASTSSTTEISAQNASLIVQLNAAAAVNPLLAQILTLAAQGKASTQQLQALTAYIQATTSIAQKNKEKQQQLAIAKPAKKRSGGKKRKSEATEVLNEDDPALNELKAETDVNAKRDVIFEFRENINDRWLFPEDAILEATTMAEPFDLVASFYLPSDNKSLPTQANPHQAVTMHLSAVTERMWRSLQRATNDVDVVCSSFKDKMRYIPNRVYLQYRTPTDVPAPLEDLLNERAARQAAGKDDSSIAYHTLPKRKSEDAPTQRVKRAKSDGKPDDPKKCAYCGNKNSPMWRRGPDGPGTLCNSCGVKWKHGKVYNGEDEAQISEDTTTATTTPVSKPALPGKRRRQADRSREADNESSTTTAPALPIMLPILSLAFAGNAEYPSSQCKVTLTTSDLQISLTNPDGDANMDNTDDNIEITRDEIASIDIELSDETVTAKIETNIPLSKFGKSLLDPDKKETLIVCKSKSKLNDGQDVKTILEAWKES